VPKLITNDEFEKEYQKKENLNVISFYCRKFGYKLPQEEVKAGGARALWKALRIHDPQKGKLVTVLGACVKNECKKIRKDLQKYSSQHTSSTFDNTISVDQNNENGEIIERLLTSVNAREEEIIRLKYYEGKTFQEIGEIYNVSKQRIQQIILRAFQKIQNDHSWCI